MRPPFRSPLRMFSTRDSALPPLRLVGHHYVTDFMRPYLPVATRAGVSRYGQECYSPSHHNDFQRAKRTPDLAPSRVREGFHRLLLPLFFVTAQFCVPFLAPGLSPVAANAWRNLVQNSTSALNLSSYTPFTASADRKGYRTPHQFRARNRRAT